MLYLQAEIHQLEGSLTILIRSYSQLTIHAADLQQYAEDDAQADKSSARSSYSRNWHKLANSADDQRQWNTFLLLREKLEKYNDTLVKQALVSKYYSEPKSHNLEILKTCLTQHTDYLLGKDSTIWEDASLTRDLMTLKSNGSDDGFVDWIAARLVKPFHELVGKRIRKPSKDFDGMTEYKEETITQVASLVATVISSVFPIVGVIILYFVKDLLARIGIIAGLTALFSLCLALVTDARRGEIFAATAAFSAVLVVFLGAA